MKKTLLSVITTVLGWRVGLFLIGLVAPFFFEYHPSFPYAYTLLPEYHLPTWLYSWANFDGVHYLTITEKGYVGTGLIQAFFPGYPVTVWLFNTLINNSLISGLVVSHVFLLVCFYLWQQLITHESKPNSWWLGFMVLLLFPSSFFLGAVYSESLFLSLVFGAFLAARARRWWLAGVLAGVASGTRIVGIFLVPALIIEYLSDRWQLSPTLWPLSQFKSHFTPLKLNDYGQLLLLTVFGSAGLLGYMWYLQGEFKDPLYFLHVQAEFGAGRSESIVLYPQVVWRYLKILATYQAWDWSYFAYLQEFVIGVGGFMALVWSVKSVRLSYWIFSVAAFILPTLTGSFSSMPRYILASFALFIMISQSLQSRRWLALIYLLGSMMILIINTMLFIQGYWVS